MLSLLSIFSIIIQDSFLTLVKFLLELYGEKIDRTCAYILYILYCITFCIHWYILLEITTGPFCSHDKKNLSGTTYLIQECRVC